MWTGENGAEESVTYYRFYFFPLVLGLLTVDDRPAKKYKKVSFSNVNELAWTSENTTKALVWLYKHFASYKATFKNASVWLGTLSNDDDDARDDVKKKMNLYFSLEFSSCVVRLLLSELTQSKCVMPALNSKLK